MAFGGKESAPQNSIPALITKLADGLGKLVTEHITLARLELAEDARSVGGDVARLAMFVPFVLVGYAFICGAIAVLLARWLTLGGSLALIGLLNAGGGAFGLYRAASRLRAARVMGDSMAEFTQSAQVLAQTASPSASVSASKNTVKELP